MMNLTPPTQRTITTEAELQALVAKALTTGVLDISHCTIEVDFNLPALLKYCGELGVEVENDDQHKYIQFKCTFSINAQSCVFTKFVDFTGVVLIRDIDFSNTNFEQGSHFRLAVFEKLANFNNVTFSESAYFRETKFKSGANFNNATSVGFADFVSTLFGDGDIANFHSVTFVQFAEFSKATFHKFADFNNATFNEFTNFSEVKFDYAHFSNSRFIKSVYFTKTQFGEVDKPSGFAVFTRATFGELLYFDHANFNQFACFEKAEFKGYVNFNHATFAQKGNFCDAIFMKAVNFENARFTEPVDSKNSTFKSSVKLSASSFNNSELIIDISTFQLEENGLIILDYQNTCIVQDQILNLTKLEYDGDAVRLKIRNLSAESKAKILFEKCHFYGKNVAFTEVAMHNVAITGGNTVKGMLFDHCDFTTTTPTEWQLQHLHFRSLAGEDQWLNSTDPEKLKERALVYASLKTTATQGGETQLANDFHFWQQYYQGKCKSSPWNTMYKYTSAYGLDVILPVFWFIRVLVTFACVYALLLKPVTPTTVAFVCFYIGFFSLLPMLIEDNINPPLRKYLYFIRIYLFLVGLVLLVGLDKGLPLSFSGSFPFVFADNDTIKELLPSIPETFSITWASGKVLLFYLLYIFQHLLQGFLLFQIGAAIRNKVKR